MPKGMDSIKAFIVFVVVFLIMCTISIGGDASAAVSIRWTAPTTYVDGLPLTVAQYKIYYGTQHGVYPYATTLGASSTSYTFTSLTPGTYYMVVTAFDTLGNESPYSNEVTRVEAAAPDTTAPSISSFSIPATSASLNIPISSLSASDNVGVTGYCITEVNSSGSCSWSGSAPVIHIFGSMGSKTLYAWARDAAGNVSTSRSATVTITLSAQSSQFSVIVFRDGYWYFDVNSNRLWEQSTDAGLSFGLPGDIPVSGDWTGTGSLKIGVFRNGYWYLDLNGNSYWDGCSVDACLPYGKTGDIPVIGDWDGTGTTKIGVFRDGSWYLDMNGNSAWDGCSVDACLSFGKAGDMPITGDWNSSGTDKIGLFRKGIWYLDTDGNGKWNQAIDITFGYGLPSDKPVVLAK